MTGVNLHEPVAAAKGDGVGVSSAQQQRAAEGGEYLEGEVQEVRLAVRIEVRITCRVYGGSEGGAVEEHNAVFDAGCIALVCGCMPLQA